MDNWIIQVMESNHDTSPRRKIHYINVKVRFFRLKVVSEMPVVTHLSRGTIFRNLSEPLVSSLFSYFSPAILVTLMASITSNVHKTSNLYPPVKILLFSRIFRDDRTVISINMA